MKKIILTIIILATLAIGCQNVSLKQEEPSSPAESYQPIPK